MPELCNTPQCGSTSCTVCPCCNQTVCREHFLSHDHLIHSKLNMLSRQIDELTNELKSTDIYELTCGYMTHLNQWRLDSYKIINSYYQQKSAEISNRINQLIHKHKIEINGLKLKFAKIFNAQQTTNIYVNSLISDINILKEKISLIGTMLIEVHAKPLVISNNSIRFDISIPSHKNVLKISQPDQMIDRLPLSSEATVSNNQYLLFHQNSNLYLLDTNLSVVRQEKWSYDWIHDMCWSNSIKCFILITANKVYSVEQNTLSIEHLSTIEGKLWQSCTCSDSSLFLSKDTLNSTIEEYKLYPSIEFVKLYERGDSENVKQRIDCIEYRDGTIALAINDQTKEDIFIELRSMDTFSRLWICQLTVEYTERKIKCCPFIYNSWLVADWGTSSIFQIKNNGTIDKRIEYQSKINHVNLFGKNKLIVSTRNSFNFHKI